AAGRWPLADGRWPMADGCWPLAAGRWLLAAGRWLLAMTGSPPSRPIGNLCRERSVASQLA
ncbi:MAG: hypothetical protein ACK562_14895, partial [Acidobacteriota bacterium]